MTKKKQTNKVTNPLKHTQIYIFNFYTIICYMSKLVDVMSVKEI